LLLGCISGPIAISLGKPGWNFSEAAPCAAWALHKPRSAAVVQGQTSQKKMRHDAFSSSAASCWNMSKLVGWC
jgi:hypothetical protein